MKKEGELNYIYDLIKNPGQSENPKEELVIDRIFIQTRVMNHFYNRFHDVAFMDATYKTNKHNLALVLISSVNSEGKNILLGVAFLSSESTDNYTWILSNLKSF